MIIEHCHEKTIIMEKESLSSSMIRRVNALHRFYELNNQCKRCSYMMIIEHCHERQLSWRRSPSPHPWLKRSMLFTGLIRNTQWVLIRHDDHWSLPWKTIIMEEESLSSSMIRRVNALHRFDELKYPVQKVINHIRFVAGKVRPLGLEGLGVKVREVFKDSEVLPFQAWQL